MDLGRGEVDLALGIEEAVEVSSRGPAAGEFQARQLDDTAALESASWGAFQIMGFHATRLGYASVQAFAAAMAQDENAQFNAFVAFIEADPVLHKALKARKWKDFAAKYNGPSYARTLYDVKLERAYQRHAGCGCGQQAAA